MTKFADAYPEHSRTSCSDEKPVNISPDGSGCARCNALAFDRLKERDAHIPLFMDAARPMIKWLSENKHPHHCVIITATGAELLESQQTFVTEEYLRD